jgi:hypothetical protein
MSGVRVYGVEITDSYARTLIGGLTNAGTPAALAAAKQISGALDRHDSAGRLTPEMRDAILAALPTTSSSLRPGLRHLHRTLLNDHEARRDTGET